MFVPGFIFQKPKQCFAFRMLRFVNMLCFAYKALVSKNACKPCVSEVRLTQIGGGNPAGGVDRRRRVGREWML